ncbi:MAG: hypothetical protein WBN40_07585 [Pseudomonadales bacterium]
MEHEKGGVGTSSGTRAVDKLVEIDANELENIGIQVEEIGQQSGVLSMSVTDKMVDSHNICHVGFLFLLADTAFAYALAAAGLAPITPQAAFTIYAVRSLADNRQHKLPLFTRVEAPAFVTSGS